LRLFPGSEVAGAELSQLTTVRLLEQAGSEDLEHDGQLALVG
jgi:hypothetical protein